MALNADVEIMASVFRRNGGEGEKTKLFANLWPYARDHILAEANLAPDEKAVIAYASTDTDWCAITTQRVIWHDSESVRSIPLLSLKSAHSDMDVSWKRWVAREVSDPKLAMRVLRIDALDGSRHKVTVEPGTPYIAMLNTLMWLCHWAAARRREAANP